MKKTIFFLIFVLSILVILPQLSFGTITHNDWYTVSGSSGKQGYIQRTYHKGIHQSYHNYKDVADFKMGYQTGALSYEYYYFGWAEPNDEMSFHRGANWTYGVIKISPKSHSGTVNTYISKLDHRPSTYSGNLQTLYNDILPSGGYFGSSKNVSSSDVQWDFNSGSPFVQYLNAQATQNKGWCTWGMGPYNEAQASGYVLTDWVKFGGSWTQGFPDPPTSLSISNSGGHPYLTWNAPSYTGSTYITGYDIYRDLGAGFSYLGHSSATHYLDSGIDYDRFGSNTAYYYVIAINHDNYESLKSNTASCGTNSSEKRLADNPLNDETAKSQIKFELKENYPDPFNASTTIRYSLPEAASLTLKIFDISGREIRQLVSQRVSSGAHQVIWDGKNNSGQEVSSGVYIYEIRTPNFVQSRKMIMVK